MALNLGKMYDTLTARIAVLEARVEALETAAAPKRRGLLGRALGAGAAPQPSATKLESEVARLSAEVDSLQKKLRAAQSPPADRVAGDRCTGVDFKSDPAAVFTRF